jgi:hypothetical protein
MPGFALPAMQNAPGVPWLLVRAVIAGVGPDAMATTQHPDLAGECSAAVSRSPVFVGVGTAARTFLVFLAGDNPFLGYCF